MTKKDNYDKGVFVQCRFCGLRYVEDYSWLFNDGITICESCGNKLKIKCSTSKDTDKDPINKLNILKETSTEMCRYVSYLEYLRDYNSDYANILANEELNKVNAQS
jgi:hypothetical protein